MENNGFKRAGSLVDEPIQPNNTFLKPAGPLEEPLKINNTFLKPAGSLEETIEANETFINPNQTFFKPAGDLDSTSKLKGDLASKIKSSSEVLNPAGLLNEQQKSKSSVTMPAADLEKKLFGRVLDKTPEGYQDALARRNAAWKEYEEIDNIISNGTATEEDWEKHDEVVERYRRESAAAENIKSYLENNPNRVNKNEVNPSSVGFEIAGDLNTPTQNNSFRFEEIEMDFKSPEEIRACLKTIVSGEKKANYAFGEGLQATSAGHKFVSIEELQQMVKNGDNIIKAEYFDNMNMVMVEFESFKMPSKSR